jgi:ketosteroid isomerase-like protein
MQDDRKQEKIDNLIESAMRRLDARSPEKLAADDRKELERLDLGRRDYDVALAKRLVELRTVIGENAAAVPPAPPPITAPEPALQGSGFRTGTLLATALLSAVVGAGAMWLAIGDNPQPAAPQVATASAPPSVAQVAIGRAQAAAPPPADDDLVREAIENWRSAWAGRDVDAYLACYSADFTPANGQKRDAWVAARRKSISTRSHIAVNTTEPKLERLDAQRMKAQFLQDYASGSYRETAQAKTLLLVRNEAGWKIAGEWQGQAPAGNLGRP